MSKLKVDELEESTSGSNITVASGTNLVVTDNLTVGGAAPYTAGGTDVAVADGGTNLSSYTVGDVLYASGTAALSKLAASTDGHVLTSTGAGSAPAWEAAAGGGDVSKVGTPVDNQVGVWTGDGTIEGDSNLTLTATTFNCALNNIYWTGGNQTMTIGGSTNGRLNVQDKAGVAVAFYYGTTDVGSVDVDSNSTTYNTTSDYRLKENEEPMTDGLSRLCELKPYRFNFKTDPEKRVDGMFAHEVSDIVPQAVSGEKDGKWVKIEAVMGSNGACIAENVSPEEWESGKESGAFPSDSTWEESIELPRWQKLDFSKFVPLLVNAIQELSAKVEALENA